ncbi:MAG: STAS domain-containing protein [Candidatus Aureabacteria bacterium]|nr:STAS domain-containing protein [Candidatus Auribacterota bacterium]
MDKFKTAIIGKQLIVKILGRGSFKSSKDLKDYVLEKLEKEADECFIDLKECISMDSTFMGMIAGLNFALKGKKGKNIYFSNITNPTRELLSTLGLLELISQKTPDESAEQADFKELLLMQGKTPGIAKHMLESHEMLSSLDKKNKEKFKKVVDSLKESIHKEKD